MQDLGAALGLAFHLIASGDAALAEIVGRSLAVSLGAVVLATLVGLPLGAALALFRFPGRHAASCRLQGRAAE